MKINLTIDGKQVQVEEGKTVLEAALDNGIYIPNLCYHPDIEPLATCRLCVVQIEGRRGYPVSCATVAEEGMVVETKNEDLQTIRRRLAWLILSELPADMPKGTQLMKVVEYCGTEELLANYAHKSKDLPVLDKEPHFHRDMNLCILCGRCVSMCQEVRGVHAIGFKNRGYKSEVSTSYGDTYQEADCKFCGACVDVCPTGALKEKKEFTPEELEATLVPCQNTCPAGIDIPRYVQLAAYGRYQDSLEVVRETVPFPHSLGLVCDHPCEAACRRNDLSGSIAIRDIKRFVAERDNGRWRDKWKIAPDTGKKVAVVGGGPSGLTAAWYLRSKGHAVTLHEALPKCGGMMTTGIPKYRLPDEVLQGEIDELKRIGVEIKTDSKIEDLDPLFKDGFDAVYLGMGAPIGSTMKIPGDEDDRVTDGIYVLKGVSFGQDMKLGGKIGVVGGGNVAMDVARTALRVGADEVNVIYRRTEKEMPADPEEIEESYNEGVKFNFLVNPVQIVPHDDHLEVICIRMQLGEPDASGRRRPVPIEGSEFSFDLDKLVVAIGQDYVVPEKFGVETDRWGSIPIDEDSRLTNRDKVFAGGDVVTGPASVIKAIHAGRLGAQSIDKYLGGDGNIDQELVSKEGIDDPFLGRDRDFTKQERKHRLTLPVKKRFEPGFPQVDQCFTEVMTVEDAKRCLKCQLRLTISEAPMPPEK